METRLLMLEILQYPRGVIIRAIIGLGIESLCGVSRIDRGEDISEYLEMMCEHELGEIKSVIKHLN